MTGLKLLLPLLMLFCASCTNDVKKKQSSQSTFDKAKWAEGGDNDFPYREEMLPDLIEHYLLHGVKYDSVKLLLGEPTRIDNGHLFYAISQKKLGIVPLSTKTLVIKLNKDSCIEWRKVHGG